MPGTVCGVKKRQNLSFQTDEFLMVNKWVAPDFDMTSMNASPQGLLTKILQDHMDWYYELSCVWNVQTWTEGTGKCCQFEWVDHSNTEIECTRFSNNSSAITAQVQLIHFTGPVKPEDSHFSAPNVNYTSNVGQVKTSESVIILCLKTFWTQF